MEGIILDPEVFSSTTAFAGGLVVLALVVIAIVAYGIAEGRRAAAGGKGAVREEETRRAA